MNKTKLILMMILLLTLVACDKQIEKPIVLNVSESVNYIYHMLSVSEVGYSNAYGETYKSLHNLDDLEYLKSVASLITVEGGKHIGELYGNMIVFPATLSSLDEVTLYYNCYIRILNGDVFTFEEQQFIESFVRENSLKNGITTTVEDTTQHIKNLPYKEELLKVSDIFIRNINIYREHVYDIEKDKMDHYIEDFNTSHSFKGVINELEDIMGLEYLEDSFVIELTTSTSSGPNAIDISNTQDLFYIIQPSVLKEFATHEMAIYILKQNKLFDLKDEFPDKSFNELWIYFESLAEYYNEELYGRKTLSYSNGSSEIIKFYKEHHTLNTKQLLLEAIRHFEVLQ
ncbi:MAG: hypothetical protein JEZ08_04700 [Clostridiales bacterium]|nr:hypothetical protein [Clostridiales bacterium]